jgi:hypothetical protein
LTNLLLSCFLGVPFLNVEHLEHPRERIGS